MPEAVLQQKIYPHDGSFDATKHPLLISYKDIVDSNNLIYTTYSTKKKRPGISPAFPITLPGNKPILAGFDFWRLGQQKVVVYNGDQFYAIDPSTGLFDNISQNFKVPVNDAVSFTAFFGLLIICFADGITPPKAWTGSGQMVDLSTFSPHPNATPLGPFCRVWLNRLWMPDPSVPGRILYTATGGVDFADPLDSGAIDLDSNDGDPDGITAIFPPFFRSLYVTKRFSTYQISLAQLSDGSTVFSESKIDDGVGCISHNAVAAAPGNIFFPSDEGVHYFVATNKLSQIDTDEFSKEISVLWQDETNFLQRKYMQGMYDKKLKSYVLLFPAFSSTYPSDVWGYSLPTKKWYRWRDYNQTCLFRYTDASTHRIQTIVGSNTGRIGVIDPTVTKDYDAPIDLYLQTGIIAAAGSPDDRYTFKAAAPIFVPQLSGSFDFTYRIDSQVIETLNFPMQSDQAGDQLGVNFVLQESFLGGTPRVKIDKRTIIGTGMLYELFISHTGIGDGNDGFEMLGILMDLDRVAKQIGTTEA